MGKWAKKWGAAGLVLLFLAAVAAADEVHLKNGDRLSGTIVTLSAGKLELETDFAGRLSINWGQVDRIETESPIEVVLADGTSLKGTAAPEAVSAGTELWLTPTRQHRHGNGPRGCRIVRPQYGPPGDGRGRLQPGLQR